MASTRPVRVDSEIVAAAEQTARQQHRSTAEQVNRWARLGKHLDLSMSVDQRRIERFFVGDVQFKDLTDEERAVAHAGLDADLEERAGEVSFGHEALREGITVVAVDDQGQIVETAPDGSSRVL